MRLRLHCAAMMLAAAATPTIAATSKPVVAPLELLQPADGATLRAGDIATLQWQPTTALGAGTVEEWEAFLSLDGGRTFSRRITPHLDIALRTVAWLVPNTPSDDARLLLRIGDERSETEIVLPVRLRIDARSRAAGEWQRLQVGTGEPARHGSAGVVAWVGGDRSGRGGKDVESTPAPRGVAAGHTPRLRNAGPDAPCDRRAGAPSLTPPRVAAAALAVAAARLLPPPPLDRVRSVLDLLQRWNE